MSVGPLSSADPHARAAIETAASARMPRVVVAASLGTIFEFYDFMLYGSLAAFFGVLFFPPGSSTAALLASLATFGAGFAVRPIGALVFGHLGDRVGRKRTFLITIVLMGASTALVGALPTYASIGLWAPVLLVALRLTQGLALGGEFGGAALYIAEHCPPERRGFYTSWIQTTGTMGLVLSLVVILACRFGLGEEAFREWGWRIPFLISVVLLALSVYVRAKLGESPLFAEIRERGELSANPVRESFSARGQGRRFAAALIVGAAMALTWYAAQFYSLVFMQTALQIDGATASMLSVAALLLGIPLFVAAGALSDRIGRKPVMIVGMVLAAASYLPAYSGLLEVGNPQLAAAQAAAPVIVHAPPARFSIPLDPGSIDEATRVRDMLARRGISYENAPPLETGRLHLRIGERLLAIEDANALGPALDAAAYPRSGAIRPIAGPADFSSQHAAIVALILSMIVGAALTCGPGAGFMAELFPTRIRYTSLSVPYHLTSAWFGGFLPFVTAWLVARSGDVLSGLYYPMAVAGTCALLGLWLIPETRHRSL